MKIDEYFELDAFSPNIEKNNYFFSLIKNLIKHHYKNSSEYRRILDHLAYDLDNNEINRIPFLPVNLFKSLKLRSIPENKIFKTLKSSGTSNNKPSQIYLDKENSRNQIKILSKIISPTLGKERLPMLVIDKKPSLEDRTRFDAKTAAFYGFSIFGKNYTFVLNDKGLLDYDILNDFLKKYGSSNFLIFGFTSLVYQNLYIDLIKKKLKFNFSKGILLHGGGWKKMFNIKVNNYSFKKNLKNKLGLSKIFNYYGLVEQTGSIFIECGKCSSFLTSIFSDIIIRDQNFNVQPNGKKGFIQLISLLPTSYPGHSILTEDIGEIINNKCDCSKIGKRFIVHGRIKKAEVRGCSDI
tara:strand:- start:2047 stop:3102 length:1056 start_codon:yes stop_codon:yes gene_type:complete